VAGTAIRIASVAIRDFRNLARVELPLAPEGLVLVGDNGHGKTNVLEAVYFLQLLRSVRGARDADCTRFGADGFHLKASGDFGDASELSVGFDRPRKKKKVMVDGVEAARLGDALGHLPSIFLSPDDQRLASGSPADRRRYLDITLALTSRRYLSALAAYRGALARRNAALREAARLGGGPVAVERAAVWEPMLAQHGAVLWEERRAWVSRWSGRYAEWCSAIGERGTSTLRLTTPGAADGGDDAEGLAEGLARQRTHDLRRGVTQAGPHRDDLVLALGGRDLRTFGSAGQQRTAAFALRLLEAATLREACGASPVLLLDDPFAELDVGRSHRILGLLGDAGMGQTILCVPRADDVPKALTALTRRTIRDGVLGAS
jgi:DNA replication and repair protein RecF